MDHQNEDFARGDPHPALSPAAGADSLFLAGLNIANISSQVLASELRKNRDSSSNMSLNTVATDDFLSAVDNLDDLASLSDDYDEPNNYTIPELEDSDEEPETTTRKMATNVSTAPKPTPMPPKKALVTPEKKTEDQTHLDAAEHVYEGAKGAWAWGKGVPVFSPFMGLAETVAGKALEITGTTLEDVDQNLITPQLKNLDNGVINPAIEAVVGIVLGAAGKTEDIIKPLIITILSPFGLIKNEAENPEVTK